MSSFFLVLAVTTITFLIGSTNCCVSINAGEGGHGGHGGGGGGGHGAPSTGGGKQASSSHNQIFYWILYLFDVVAAFVYLLYFLTCTNRETVTLSSQRLKKASKGTHPGGKNVFFRPFAKRFLLHFHISS